MTTSAPVVKTVDIPIVRPRTVPQEPLRLPELDPERRITMIVFPVRVPVEVRR